MPYLSANYRRSTGSDISAASDGATRDNDATSWRKGRANEPFDPECDGAAFSVSSATIALRLFLWEGLSDTTTTRTTLLAAFALFDCATKSPMNAAGFFATLSFELAPLVCLTSFDVAAKTAFGAGCFVVAFDPVLAAAFDGAAVLLGIADRSPACDADAFARSCFYRNSKQQTKYSQQKWRGTHDDSLWENQMMCNLFSLTSRILRKFSLSHLLRQSHPVKDSDICLRVHRSHSGVGRVCSTHNPRFFSHRSRQDSERVFVRPLCKWVSVEGA
jgi:hypothetical protein